MKKRRRLFGHKKKQTPSGEVMLQITSMADIFTILLVFLLKGLAQDALQISPSTGTRLPAGFNTSSLDEKVLQVEIAKNAILVEKEFVMPLQDYKVADAKSVQKDGTFASLGTRLNKERDRQKLIAQTNDTVKIDPRAIIMSDQDVPFTTMKHVLKSLAAYGYSEIKFAVVKE